MQSQAPDLAVQFVQKVYSENVLNVRHDVWDVHTDVDRWWVITDPMNLYSQDQFPNMDLALTFHVGLNLRIPRSDRQKLSDLPVEPFAEAYRYIQEATDALAQASEVADYQSVGVRCREALLAFVKAAQTVVPWAGKDEPPKKADWHDAEAAIGATENAISLCTSAVILHVRGVPEQCPSCGSHRLSPQRGYRQDLPEVEWERPTCEKCGWTGKPVALHPIPEPHDEPSSDPPEGECIMPKTPLRELRRPKRDD